MNPDEPEYQPEDYEQAMAEPGLPDEMVAEVLAEEPPDFFGFNAELIAENSPILLLAVVALLATESVKALGLRWWCNKKKGYDEDTKALVYRWALFFVSGVTGASLGFNVIVLDVTGLSISYIESFAGSGLIVGAIAAGLYSLKVTKALKAAFYKKIGVTDDDLKTRRKEPAVTPEDIAAHNEADDDGT